MKKRGIIYGVSVGPGNPEYVTIQAVNVLKRCDIIAIPAKDRESCFAYSIAKAAVPEIADKEVLCIPMPMTHNRAERESAFAEGAGRLKEKADEGKDAAFITTGDVCVYSTYLYLHERLAADGYCSKLISGVTSFCAAAAETGIALCMDKEELHVIPASSDIEKSLRYKGCKVFMKGSIPEIKAALAEKEMNVTAVEKCGTEEQTIYRSLEEIPDDAGYFTIITAKEKK